MRIENKVRLVICGFEGSASEISAIVGADPTKTWRRGDQVVPIAMNVHKDNGWQLDSPLDATSASAHDSIGAIFALIPDPSLRQRLPEGATIQMTITQYAYDVRPFVFLGADTIAKLALCGADLDIDVYDLSKSEDCE